jgi:hypothetical protein
MIFRIDKSGNPAMLERTSQQRFAFSPQSPAASRGERKRMSTETTIPLDARYVRDESVVARLVGQEFLLVPTRANVAEMDHIFVLNPVAARIWELLDGKRTITEIGALICDEFDVDSASVERDVAEFLDKLLSVGIARRV